MTKEYRKIEFIDYNNLRIDNNIIHKLRVLCAKMQFAIDNELWCWNGDLQKEYYKLVDNLDAEHAAFWEVERFKQ